MTTKGLYGNIAECGVWRGGSMMAVARALMFHGDSNCHLYLYDTFEGMSEPTEHDKRFSGEPAKLMLDREPVGTGVWCLASIEDVRTNMLSTGYPEEKVHFIKGKVEETLPSVLPEALLAAELLGRLAAARKNTICAKAVPKEMSKASTFSKQKSSSLGGFRKCPFAPTLNDLANH